MFGKIASEVGLPAGLLNVVQGYGLEAGKPLTEHPDVGVISFTGSTRVGLDVHAAAGKRLARVSLELGGKNALVVAMMRIFKKLWIGPCFRPLATLGNDALQGAEFLSWLIFTKNSKRACC